MNSWRSGLGAAVHGVVLRRGDGAVVYLGRPPARPSTKATPMRTGEEGIFAVGFKAAAPAPIAKNIDIRRPDGQSEKRCCADVVAHRLLVFRARFDGDDVGDPMPGRGTSRVKARAVPFAAERAWRIQSAAMPCRPCASSSRTRGRRGARGMAAAWFSIWPTFSSRVIACTTASTRLSRGWEESSQDSILVFGIYQVRGR